MSSAPATTNHLIAPYRGRLQQGQAALREAFFATDNPEQMLTGRSALLDEVLSSLWQELKFPAKLALIAVGGYGRGELYPASDIDLLILLPEAPNASQTAKLEQLVGLFWDIGLEVGHSVRTLDECLSERSEERRVGKEC